MRILKIAVTGGPCGGKTSALSHIRALAEGEGYRVLTVGETATELIGGGVAPRTCRTNAEYQAYQMDLQMKKEEIFLSAARGMPCARVLIVCDRGILDNRAYMTEEEFSAVLSARGERMEDYLAAYDAVFHLVTAAEGAEKFYTVANNKARTESPEEARRVDARLLSAWEEHPRRFVLDNGGDFSDKMSRLSGLLLPLLREETV